MVTELPSGLGQQSHFCGVGASSLGRTRSRALHLEGSILELRAKVVTPAPSRQSQEQAVGGSSKMGPLRLPVTSWPSSHKSLTATRPGSSEGPTYGGDHAQCVSLLRRPHRVGQTEPEPGRWALTSYARMSWKCMAEIQAGQRGSLPRPLSPACRGHLLATSSRGLSWEHVHPCCLPHSPPDTRQTTRGLPSPPRLQPHLSSLTSSSPSPDSQSEALGLRAPTHKLPRDTAQPATQPYGSCFWTLLRREGEQAGAPSSAPARRHHLSLSP